MSFQEELPEHIKEIEEQIKTFLPKQEGLQERVIEAANYSVLAGGKRIRPMLMLETYRLFGGTDICKAAPFMAALECIHTYSLVHDDLPAMDNDDYRRGKLTTHKKYGEDFGVLAGDALLNYAYEIMLDYLVNTDDEQIRKNGLAASRIIAKKAGIYGMVGGQSLDVWLTGKSMNAEQMQFIFNLKTAALIEAAMMAGAYLAGADESQVRDMEKAGNLIGVAFQIQDDILDVTSTLEQLGKPIHSDEKNNKTTYVSLYGIEKAHRDVKEMSEQALALIEAQGENVFLKELVAQLIDRKK